MKKNLFSILFIASFSFSNKLIAQCEIVFQNLVIEPVAVNSLPDSKCEVTFNASFDIQRNNGFKYLFFHSWLVNDYPNPPIFDCSGSTPAADPGTAQQLGTAIDQTGKSFLDLGFIGLKEITDTISMNTPIDVTANIATLFPHDTSVVLIQPANSPGMTATLTLSGDTLHFEITNIKVVINGACNAASLAVYTDIWGSNSNAKDPKAQCYVCKIGTFFGDPTINGFKLCNSPRTYALSITTVDPSLDEIRYKVYMDLNNNGILDPGEPLAYTSPIISISASQPYTPGGAFTLPPPYSNTNPYVSSGYIIHVVYEEPTNRDSVSAVFANPPGCALLPVTFKSFTAIRTNRANVNIKWETATEQNSAGFAIERRNKDEWEQVAYLPSQAQGGNSTSVLTYLFSDLNASKGITQYRIRQADLDGVNKLSDIRSVRGEGQSTTTIVYPNPSSDGRVNVVFEGGEITKRDISVQDMNGRIIKQWKNYSNNNIQIENLSPGFYTIRVMNAGTGELSIEKLVVNKR